VSSIVDVFGAGLFTGVTGTGNGSHGNDTVGSTSVIDVVELGTLVVADAVPGVDPFVVGVVVDAFLWPLLQLPATMTTARTAATFPIRNIAASSR
jgi:hypothetical protein